MDEIVHVSVPRIVRSVTRDTCRARVGLERVGVRAHVASTKAIAELMMSNLDAGDPLRDGSRTGWQRSTDANDGEEEAGGILNRLLHVLAEVTHLGGLGVWTIGQSCVRRSVS
jgi:hypothetical protein